MLVQATSAGMQDKLIDYPTTAWPFCSSGTKVGSVQVQCQVFSLDQTFNLSPQVFPDKTEQREATRHRGRENVPH